jgi:hypothetical protein
MAGGALSAVGGLLGRRSSNRAAQRAADAQAQAGRESNQLNWNMTQANAQLQDPFRLGGGAAYNEYLQMLGMAPQEFRPAGEIFGQYGSNGTGTPAISGPATASSGALPSNLAGAVRFIRDGGLSQSGALTGELMPRETSPASASQPRTGYTPQQVMERLQSKPGYQFRLGEGQRAVEAGAAARGGLNSGAALRALTRYGQNFGTQEYDNELNRLSVLFGGAQRATDNISNSASQFGQTAGNNAINTGNARANMYQQQGANNAGFWGGLFGQGARALGQFGGYGG